MPVTRASRSVATTGTKPQNMERQRTVGHHDVRREPIEQDTTELLSVEDFVVFVTLDLKHEPRVIRRVPHRVGVVVRWRLEAQQHD